METLEYFLLKVCGITADWKLENMKEDEIEKVKRMVGQDDHVICALSGGVGSTVAATLVHQAIGDRLHCVFVDNGLCRYKERERIMSPFEKDLHLPVTCVDASEQPLSKLKGVVGAEFTAIFDEYSQLEREREGSERSLPSLCRELCTRMLLSHALLLEVENRTPTQCRWLAEGYATEADRASEVVL